MRRITTISLAALMAVSSLGLFACKNNDEKKDQKKGGEAKSKLDCKAICKRTFETCLEDIMLGTGQVTKEQVELIKKMGKLKEAGKQGYDQCLSKCKDQKGMASDGDKINECMKKKSCKDFAECMKSIIDV